MLWFVTAPLFLFVSLHLRFVKSVSTYLSCFVSRSETNIAQIAVLPKLNLPEVRQVVSRMRVLPMKEMVEILRSRMEELERLWRENASHTELRLHLQEILTLYRQLDGLQLEFEEELEAEDPLDRKADLDRAKEPFPELAGANGVVHGCQGTDGFGVRARGAVAQGAFRPPSGGSQRAHPPASNAPEALVDQPTEEIFRNKHSRLWKTLCVSWNPQEDELTFRPSELVASRNQETKRDLLRTAASVFDPLGGLTPFTVQAKRMFQSLWQTGMLWDDNFPAEIELQWRVWKLELNDLHCIAMPRAYFPFSLAEASRFELHGFGDASEAAYAAVVYLRAAKSRVASLKKLSIPRLELMAALLCARLVCYMRKELALDVEACHCWSDSKVALGGNGDANRWKPFVANRVREIHALTPSQWWRYCPNEDNPVDLASRGCSVKNLFTSLKGPTWLRGPPETWPQAEWEERIEGLEVLKKKCRATAALVTVSPPQDAATVINPGGYSSFESFERLIRVAAWCRRFWHNTTLPASSRRTGTGLTTDELKEAERIWIRQEQIHAFGSQDSTDKSMTKMLCGLSTFLDEFGVLRMMVNLLIRREHNRQLHAGVAQTLAVLRERFWILRGRSAVERVIRTCGICRLVAARPLQQRMGDLPAIRVNPAGPFSSVGIDFVGPLLIRGESSKYRNTLKRRAGEETKLVPQIYNEECSSASTSLETADRPYPCGADIVPGRSDTGLLLHFYQAVQRKVADLGLLKKIPSRSGNEEKDPNANGNSIFPLSEVPAAVDLLGRNVTGSVAALFDYFRREWMTPNKLPLWNESTETLIQQVTSGRVTANDLRVKNNKYEKVKLRITALTAEYDGGTRTMEQFRKAIANDVSEPVNF
ncbi:hypothetical protein T10_8300 [Trichinella papuae]|uniref:Integrase zinc-binding domain-containing protein n=1 Tax=Trichinella papuae TaxID=268474 RepID=A0A0V1MNZ8_9BILA|nr:hypothetical protein T10_8300 [Trichinella papuae]